MLRATETRPSVYYALQTEARKRVVTALNAKIMRSPGALAVYDRLTLSSILSPDMPSALDFVAQRWAQARPAHFPVGFTRSWESIVMANLSDHDAFDLAMWQDVDGEQVLAALMMATPSKGHGHLTVRWVERYHGKTHIAGRVLPVILSCAEAYAKLLGSERVLVKDAIVPELYERYGYQAYRHPYVPHGGKYLAKEV